MVQTENYASHPNGHSGPVVVDGILFGGSFVLLRPVVHADPAELARVAVAVILTGVFVACLAGIPEVPDSIAPLPTDLPNKARHTIRIASCDNAWASSVPQV